jgi:hypothetical protein
VEVWSKETEGELPLEAVNFAVAGRRAVGAKARLGVAIGDALTVGFGEIDGEGLQAYGTRLRDVSRHPLSSQMSAQLESTEFLARPGHETSNQRSR